VGRKAKVQTPYGNGADQSQIPSLPNAGGPLHKVHDLEIENDSTVSFHQCYFSYKPTTKEWCLQDGKLDLQNPNPSKKGSSNGTWLYLHKPHSIENG